MCNYSVSGGGDTGAKGGAKCASAHGIALHRVTHLQTASRISVGTCTANQLATEHRGQGKCRRQCFAAKSIWHRIHEKGQRPPDPIRVSVGGMEPKPDPKSWSETSLAAFAMPNRALLVMCSFLPAASDFELHQGLSIGGRSAVHLMISWTTVE